MIYVLDTSVFKVLGHYYPSAFPGFWAALDKLVEAGTVVSTREVVREVETNDIRQFVLDWIGVNHALFSVPTPDEGAFVAQIFAIPHFQQLMARRKLLTAGPFADPWVIAKAATTSGGCVVSQESLKPNAARIPNVCAHFQVPCIKVEDWMQREGWAF